MRTANDNHKPPHHLVVEELPDGREVAVRAPLPERVTFEAVFCADCSRLSLVKQPGRLCAGCQERRDEGARWAELRRLTSGGARERRRVA